MDTIRNDWTLADTFNAKDEHGTVYRLHRWIVLVEHNIPSFQGKAAYDVYKTVKGKPVSVIPNTDCNEFLLDLTGVKLTRMP